MVITVAPPTLATIPVSSFHPSAHPTSVDGCQSSDDTTSRLTMADSASSRIVDTTTPPGSPVHRYTNRNYAGAQPHGPVPACSTSATPLPDATSLHRSHGRHTVSVPREHPKIPQSEYGPMSAPILSSATPLGPLNAISAVSLGGQRRPGASGAVPPLSAIKIFPPESDPSCSPSRLNSVTSDTASIPCPGKNLGPSATAPSAWYIDCPRQSARLRMKREHDDERERSGTCPDTPITIGGSDDELSPPPPVSRRKRAKHTEQRKPSRMSVSLGKEAKHMVLVSAYDEEYQVSAELLMSSCTLFQDAMHGLRDPPAPSADHEDENRRATTVEIPHSGQTLSLAIKLLQNQDFPSKLPFAQMQQLLELGSFLGSQIITDRLIAHLHIEIRSSPWAVFLIAAHLIDLPLARNALGQMYRHDNKKFRNMSAEDVMSDIGEPLSKRWALALYGALSSHPHVQVGKSAVKDRACLRWMAVSDAFDPYRVGK